MSAIYGLCDPDLLEVRYVGKTTRPLADRLRNHLNDAKRNRTIVANWIRSVGRPVLVVLEADPPDLSEAEQRWIANLRVSGARLTNMTDGGTGGATFTGRKHTPETRAKIADSQRGQVRSPLSANHRAKLSRSLSGRRLSTEHRARISAARRARSA